MEKRVGAGALRSYIYSIVAILLVTGLAGSQFEPPANSIFSAHQRVADVEIDPIEAQSFVVLLPNGEKAEGLIAIPRSAAPQALVVLCHAFGGNAEDFRPTLVDLAGKGAVAVAMQYRGPSGSFNVKTGVEDTVAATEFLLSTYPSINTTLIYGFSMGGAVAGVTVATMAPNTFDHLIAGAPVVDLASLWQHGESFRRSLEAEAGGRPRDVRLEYQGRSPSWRVDDIAAANLTSIVVVHARADPVVQYSDARDFYIQLEEQGAPATLIAVSGTKAPWACSRLERICAANPWATLESHMVGHVPTIGPLLFGLLDGTWTPTPGFQEIQVKGDERVPRLLP